jgi:hypothetical protein
MAEKQRDIFDEAFVNDRWFLNTNAAAAPLTRESLERDLGQVFYVGHGDYRKSMEAEELRIEPPPRTIPAPRGLRSMEFQRVPGYDRWKAEVWKTARPRPGDRVHVFLIIGGIDLPACAEGMREMLATFPAPDNWRVTPEFEPTDEDYRKSCPVTFVLGRARFSFIQPAAIANANAGAGGYSVNGGLKPLTDDELQARRVKVRNWFTTATVKDLAFYGKDLCLVTLDEALQFTGRPATLILSEALELSMRKAIEDYAPGIEFIVEDAATLGSTAAWSVISADRKRAVVGHR